MSLAGEIKSMKHAKRTGDFAHQLAKMKELGQKQGAGAGVQRLQLGIDRSRELSPVARPSTTRALCR